MNTSTARHGVLLVGHGTRDPVGRDEFLRTAKLVGDRMPGVEVEPCFLELARPTISEGVHNMLDKGAEKITVTPLLLFAAGHAKQDVPDAVQDALSSLRDSAVAAPRLQQTEHLGCEPALLELSARRYREAVHEFDPDGDVQEGSVRLLLLGRGSKDLEATAEMHEFARRRAKLTPVDEFAVGFLAMASPGVAESAEQLARDAPHLVVVQPHLLFGGQLVDRVGETVDQLAHSYPRTSWLLARPLGPDPLLADAIVARIRRCGG